MESSHSSSTSQHYAVMIGQLTELKQELERSASQNQVLIEEKRQFQSIMSSLKVELTEAKKKYNETQENYLSTVTSKFEADRQSEIIVENLKYQLTDKMKEFEAFREKLAPQDIDYIKIKVQEELEIPHRAKVQALEKEAERQRELFYTVTRKYELLKVEHETQIQSYTREISNLRDGHVNKVASLNDTITRLRDREYSPEKDDQIRAEKTRVHELENQLKSVMNEAKTLRSERDNAIALAENAKSRQDEAYMALRTKLTILEAETKALEHRNSSLLHDVEKRDSRLYNMEQTSEELNRQLQYYKTLATDREAQLFRDKTEAEEELCRVRSSCDKQLDELDEKNTVLQHKLRDREESLRRAQRDASEMQLRAETLESEVRKTYFHQLLEARQRAESLELELSDSAELHRQSELQLKLAFEQSTSECDRLKSDNSRLAREKDVLHGHLRDLELRLEGERRSGIDLKRGREEAQRLLKARETEAGTMRQNLEQLRTDMSELANELTRKDIEHKRQWEYVQSEVQKRYESLGMSYKRRIEECIRKGRVAVMKERKRADAYKSRAIDLHRKSKNFQVTEL